jgi:hypothetical protein
MDYPLNRIRFLGHPGSWVPSKTHRVDFASRNGCLHFLSPFHRCSGCRRHGPSGPSWPSGPSPVGGTAADEPTFLQRWIGLRWFQGKSHMKIETRHHGFCNEIWCSCTSSRKSIQWGMRLYFYIFCVVNLANPTTIQYLLDQPSPM